MRQGAYTPRMNPEHQATKGHVRKAGLPPGMPIYTGEPRQGPLKITVIDFSPDHLEEREGLTVEEIKPYVTKNSVTWVHIDGVHDARVVQQICDLFSVHALAIEDILTIGTRPKCEEYETYFFIVLEMLNLAQDADAKGRPDFHIVPEQVSIVFGDGFVVTFLEDPGDIWDGVRKRLRGDASRLRRLKADYLCYALLDAVVDHYFLVLEALGDRAEALEEIALYSLEADTISRIHSLKQELLGVRKSVWPLRDVTGVLTRSTSPAAIQPSTVPYLRDLHDHVLQVIETAEIHRESTVALLELYLAGTSNRLNQVMKLLTVLTAVFIPVTFVAGIYGMNFDNMPELHWRYGYFWALGMMGSIGVGMLLYFRKQNWM
jgi:magnesium transporter